MKKILTVLLIAVMAAGFVFASVSGKAELDFGYNTATKKVAFDFTNSEVNYNFKLGEEAATANEGDIYAVATAEVNLQLANGTTKKLNEAKQLAEKVEKNVTLNAKWTAKVVAPAFTVAFYNTNTNPVDFAKSAIDTYYTATYDAFNNVNGIAATAQTLAAAMAKNKTTGVAVEAFGATVGVSLDAVAEEAGEKKYTVYAITPEVAAAGVTAQAGVVTSDVKDWGLSAKAAYAVDAFSASVASDIVLKKDTTAKFDIAGKVAYDFATADIYYVSSVTHDSYTFDADGNVVKVVNNTNSKKLLSAKVSADLATFDVPVTVAVQAKNLLDATREFKFTVAYAGVVDATVYTSFVYKTNVKYGATVAYTADMFKATAGFAAEYFFAVDTQDTLNITAEVSSDKLVSGAVLSLGWYTNTAYAEGKSYKVTTSNLLAKNAAGNWDCGNITAKCVIAF